ncbi:hypothetical protein ADT71_16125 [Novosphingobium sp. ST904]|nr:hypothetical protein ADT71_16125 [Novosphingobium sp. ST904]TCM33189.1 HxlR family transcriptional regulator [Novosphingobium sp. ST904]
MLPSADNRPVVLPGVDCSGFTRDLLSRVGDKWSVLIVVYLSARTMRFNELKRTIDGISQRMLTLTLRNLEKDGLITRCVTPTIPPRVDYALTDLGRSLLKPVLGLVEWAALYKSQVAEARARYESSEGRQI